MREKYIRCKHLDFSPKHGAEIKTIPGIPELRYWHRTNEHDCIKEVQFCKKGNRRVYGIFECYAPSEDRGCLEPEQSKEGV